MKRLILLAAVAFFALPAAAQMQEAFPSYIQVNGRAEKEIAPDEFYLQIIINERDSKGKISVESQQRDMIASNNGALSSLSKDCVMPTHQFKMAVRKKTVQVGKPIQECTADELETIAFWVETLTTSAATEKSQLGQFIVPISEIESKMRMKFFPGIPDAAKSRAGTLSAWY